jgi:protein-disulfide isomerase
MLNWRRFVGAGVAFFALAIFACQSQTKPGADPAPQAKPEALELSGVDTSKLTAREKEQWSAYVGELLAPCPDQPVSIAQCVTESRKCDACLPAAQFLVRQVTRGRTRAQAEDAFRLRFSPDEVKDVDITGSPEKGAAQAAVVITEWADFECPFCAVASPMLDEMVKRYPEHVKLVFKYYPLSSHEHSEVAARAAAAAHVQGKFWQMHHALFENQEHIDEPSIERLAEQLGLDMKRWGSDRKGEAAADKVSSDKKQADKLGLRGTPMIYINGRSFNLETFDLNEDLDDWVKLEIQLKTGKGATPAKANPGTASSASTAAATSAGAASPAVSAGQPVEIQPASSH